ncbi:hypothetical protein U0070_025257 [Myodes glareolus]|uniref:MHC class I antigen n=1 Tax=Myodes glareolus TaxID=447135 RepID=A0AAW0IN27_MYOGA
MGRGLPRTGEVTERWQLRGMGPPGALPGVTDRGRRPRHCRWSRKV